MFINNEQQERITEESVYRDGYNASIAAVHLLEIMACFSGVILQHLAS
jgi:hypothetical protein